VLRQAARWGESTVARARIAVGAIFAVLGQLSTAPAPVGALTTGLGLVLCALGLATLLLLRREVSGERLALGTILLDVSLVSVGILTLGQGAGEVSGPNQRNLFACYLVVQAATGLRYDPRLCLYATAVALLQYAAVVAVGVEGRALPGASARPEATAGLSLHAHAVRFTLLGVTGVIATLVVLRVQALVTLSLRDSLTGLLNRRYFDRALAEALEAAEAPEAPGVALALLDIDHFKDFNDRFGHPVGDAALRAVAAVLRRSFRGTDVVARLGGEEFAVLLPGIGLEDAVRRIEACRRAVAATRLPDPGRRAEDGRLPPVTVSAGLAVAPADGASPGRLLRAADARLYRAKHDGRDRLVAPEPGAGQAPSCLRIAVSR